MQTKNWVLGLLAVGLVLAATSAAFDFHPGKWLTQGTATWAKAPVPPAQPAAALLAPGSSPNYRAIVQMGAPAVVGVSVVGQQVLGPNNMPLDLNSPFFQFFRELPGLRSRIPQQLPVPEALLPFHSQGSGFIIAEDGLVLTNAHLVRGAKEVLVKLHDRREFKARVLGSDPTTEIAVLRIDAKNLPVVRLGDSEQLQVGDPVLAIGAPFGFEQSASQGIVSAKGRSLPGDSAVPFIQTDAAVNPGNSGGPLFDASGAVVGINAQIYSRSGGFQGLAFAIPLAVALKVKDQILATGHASHARLGITVQELSQNLAESFGLAKPAGALVASVQAESAAAAAGLQPGDVITEMDGQAIERSGDLSSRISLQAPGDTVHLKIWRNTAASVLAVKLGRAEESATKKPTDEGKPVDGALGLSLRNLTPEEMAVAHVQTGLVVDAVSGPAARAGLEPGDVLVRFNGVAVQSTDQVRHLMDKKPKVVALLIVRNGERVFVPVELQ